MRSLLAPKLWLPESDLGSQIGNFERRVRRELPLSGGALPAIGGVGPAALMLPLYAQFPFLISTTAAVAPTAVSVTPTALGATNARVFPFYLPHSLNVAKVYMNTPNAVTVSLEVAIFDAGGTQLWTSGVQGTAANITTITPATGVRLGAGMNYYFAIVNANKVSATAAYWFSPALSAATIPRWGQVAATLGAMPTSITVGSINATVGGWPIFTVLSAV